MDDSYSVIIKHQAGQVTQSGGTVDLADGEPVRLQEFDDLDKAKQFCTRLAREAPFFKCQVFRGEEKVFELADAEWLKRQLERLRAGHTSVKRRAIAVFVLTVAILCFAIWGFPHVPYYSPTLGALVSGLVIAFLSGSMAFGSKQSLRENAEFIGTTNSKLARVAGMLGLLGAGILVVASLLRLLRKL